MAIHHFKESVDLFRGTSEFTRTGIISEGDKIIIMHSAGDYAGCVGVQFYDSMVDFQLKKGKSAWIENIDPSTGRVLNMHELTRNDRRSYHLDRNPRIVSVTLKNSSLGDTRHLLVAEEYIDQVPLRIETTEEPPIQQLIKQLRSLPIFFVKEPFF